MRKTLTSIFIVLLIVIVGFFTYQYFNKNTKIGNKVIKVGYPPVTTSLPLFVAIEKQLFQKRGLTVEPIKFGTANQIVEALVTDRIEATAVCADYPFLTMATKNSNLFKIYAWEMLDTNIAFDLIISGKDSNINTLADLEGKKIATFPGSQLKYYLGLILKNALGKEINVDIIEMAPANQIPALASKSVDALFTLEPLATITLVKGIGKVVSASPISKYIGGGDPIPAASFALNNNFIKTNPEISKKFVEAMEEAIELINKNQEKYRYLYPKFTPIKEGLSSKIPVTHFTTVDTMDIKLFQKEADILFNANLLEKHIDVTNIIYTK